jgi:hypothetical protein
VVNSYLSITGLVPKEVGSWQLVTWMKTVADLMAQAAKADVTLFQSRQKVFMDFHFTGIRIRSP